MSIFQNLVHSWSITSAYLNVLFHLTVKVTAAKSRREGAKLKAQGESLLPLRCEERLQPDACPCSRRPGLPQATALRPRWALGAGEPPCVSLLPPEGPSEDPRAEPAGKEAGSRPQQLFHYISLYFLCKKEFLFGMRNYNL